MGKVVLRIDLKVVVDTDLEGADNIMENLGINVESLSENVDVEDNEIVDLLYIENTK